MTVLHILDGFDRYVPIYRGVEKNLKLFGRSRCDS